jgi:hypothetical protein
MSSRNPRLGRACRRFRNFTKIACRVFSRNGAWTYETVSGLRREANVISERPIQARENCERQPEPGEPP